MYYRLHKKTFAQYVTADCSSCGARSGKCRTEREAGERWNRRVTRSLGILQPQPEIDAAARDISKRLPVAFECVRRVLVVVKNAQLAEACIVMAQATRSDPLEIWKRLRGDS